MPASLFELSLFGVPPSMATRPPLLDRSTAWPLDVGTAQTNWRSEYQTDDFFIGVGPYARDEHVGYFMWANGGGEALRKNGEQVGQWSDLREFLTSELERAEGLYPDHERRMAEVMQRADTATSRWRRWLYWLSK